MYLQELFYLLNNVISLKINVEVVLEDLEFKLKFSSSPYHGGATFLGIHSFCFHNVKKNSVSAPDYDIRIFLNGTRIFPSKCIKYLGVLFDSDLSWKSQINNTAIKLKRANGALVKICYFVPPHVLHLVYYAIFHSHLQYCCQVWGQQNGLEINRIFKTMQFDLCHLQLLEPLLVIFTSTLGS